MPRSILRRDLLFSLAATAAPEIIADAPSGGLPNIVLCMADDQGWGDVGFRGHPVLKTIGMRLRLEF